MELLLLKLIVHCLNTLLYSQKNIISLPKVPALRKYERQIKDLKQVALGGQCHRAVCNKTRTHLRSFGSVGIDASEFGS